MLKNKYSKMSKVMLMALVTLGTQFSFANPVDTTMSIEKKMNQNAARTQKKIDAYAESTQTMLADYKDILMKIDQNKAYNRQLELMIEDQNKELKSVEKQIVGIEDTERGLAPLMSSMIEALDQFIALDLPFRLEERERGVEELRSLMTRGDVTTSEKFRRILEAYKFEVDYGSVLDVYKDELKDVGEVEFFRVGRVAFIYRRLDGKEAYLWDRNTKAWMPVPDSYLLSIRDGIRMQRGLAQRDLIKLPIQPAEAAK